MEQQHDDIRHWNRRMLNMIWMIAVVATLAMITGLVFDYVYGASWSAIREDIVPFLIEPIIWMVGATLLGELTVRKKETMAGYTVILILVFFTSIVTIFFYFIPGIQFTLLSAIIVAALYFQRRKVIFSLVSAVSAYIVILASFQPLREITDVNTIIFSISLFLSFAAITDAVIKRGINLLKNLEQSAVDHQELFVDNIAKDRMTKIDGLTQIYNRKAFDELTGELEQRDFTFSLAMIDIDNFKSINDTYGHPIGDMVLREIAHAASRVLSNDDFICRYGGEEFAVILFKNNFAEACDLAEKMRGEIERLEFPDLGGRRITASIGLAERCPGESIDDLKEQADILLYQAKRTGKNKVMIDSYETENMM